MSRHQQDQTYLTLRTLYPHLARDLTLVTGLSLTC